MNYASTHLRYLADEVPKVAGSMSTPHPGPDPHLEVLHSEQVEYHAVRESKLTAQTHTLARQQLLQFTLTYRR